ncbi:AP-5 complex subunit sigma-1 [Notechis scutatus]|uniref:AP-5 complex subunit sigma-1 n=1 Tax=Notechis scutatus TaxID=8663 RepID=A0A6J1VW93_9SAUR|nr:AP-5 complex subunit sigma-1 [Notechis scutatus]XP_026547271.1 AP-5 complex subunit sigma-1 [Notechis scutatus]
MVRAFFIHPLRARPGEDPEPGQLLFCRVFVAEGGAAAEAPHPEKERLRTVARQVETACRLQLSLSGKQPSEHLHQPLPEEAVSLQETPFGVFRLPSGDPFSEDKTVLWLGVQGLAFALVCDPDENLMLAEGTLRLLAKALLEHLKLLTTGASDVLLKADRMEAVLEKFLPHGQLLFLNDQFVVGLERELGGHLGK